MLLLFIVLVLDAKSDLLLFLLFNFMMLCYHTRLSNRCYCNCVTHINLVTDVIVTRPNAIDHLLISWFRCFIMFLIKSHLNNGNTTLRLHHCDNSVTLA